MSAYAIDSRLLHGGIVSESGQPFYGGLFAKPGDLVLGVAPGISLRFEERLLRRQLATEHLQNLCVAVRFEWLSRFGPTHIENLFDFLHQAILEHPLAAIVQSRVQFFARRRQADFQLAKTNQSVATFGKPRSDGPTREQVNF